MSNREERLAAQLATWPVDDCSCVVVAGGELIEITDRGVSYPWASVTKLLTALTVLDSITAGTIGFDDPLGPPGSTVRHLLAHASGLAMDGFAVLAEPGYRRIYSNSGYELLADHVSGASPQGFTAQLNERVLRPLGMEHTSLRGGAGHGAVGTAADLALLGRELLRPRHLDPILVAQLSTPAFPDLPGVVPGFGRHEDCAWGLGAEIKDHKSPHWTAPSGSPRTFGHFGQSGSFLWVDPDAQLACAVLTRTVFGPWAAQAWPAFSESVVADFS